MNVGVVIGRFQFFHNGQYALIENVLKQDDVDLLVICLGTHAVARTTRNPFYTNEREAHIRACFPNTRIMFTYIHDHPNDTPSWVKETVTKVNQLALVRDKITVYGNRKEDTGWYMDLFSAHGWDVKDLALDSNLCASTVRDLAFRGLSFTDLVPAPMGKILTEWLTTEDGQTLSAAYVKECEYKKTYENLPYPPIFQATDALVTCMGYVLLVRRGSLRGKGLLAMPGGFLEADETILDGTIRELMEETWIGVTEEELRKAYRKTIRADFPYRSTIGRVISDVSHFELPARIFENGKLPAVKPSGDGETTEVLWIPMEKLRGDYYKDMDNVRIQFFEDHLQHIKTLLNHIEAMR